MVQGAGGGGSVTPKNGQNGKAPPERGPFFKVQVHERVGILLVEYERVRKSLIWVVKGPIGLTDEFYGSIMKSRKRSIFVTDSYLNDSAFTAVKKDEKFSKQGM